MASTAFCTITNDTSEAIDEWSVSWEYTDGSTVPQAWNGILAGQNPYTVSNAAHNGSIAPNRSTSFGFNGAKSTQGIDAQIPELGGETCSPALSINQAPTAVINAVPAQGNIPLNVTFNANGSSDPENDNLTYLWDFGNGETSTSATVTRTFDEEGRFPISLTVNDGQLDSEQAFTTIVATDQESEPGEPTGYVLDAQNSSLFFVTTRRTHDIESHFFTDLYGSISAENGEATLGINLNSVETGVDLRNERIRNFLFETDVFSNEAVITLPVDLDGLSSQNIGSTQVQSVSATMNLHGVSAVIDTELTVTRLSDSTIMVQNVSPILIGAEDYDLVDGVEVLRNLANLPIISYSVPVNFTLLFNTPEAQ